MLLKYQRICIFKATKGLTGGEREGRKGGGEEGESMVGVGGFSLSLSLNAYELLYICKLQASAMFAICVYSGFYF